MPLVRTAFKAGIGSLPKKKVENMEQPLKASFAIDIGRASRKKGYAL